MDQKYVQEINAYWAARHAGDMNIAWRHLERAHILGQSKFFPHIHSHWMMLRFAFFLKDGKEIMGQIFRLILAPFGNITGQLPIGNTGRANVSAFQPMDIPRDMQD